MGVVGVAGPRRQGETLGPQGAKGGPVLFPGKAPERTDPPVGRAYGGDGRKRPQKARGGRDGVCLSRAAPRGRHVPARLGASGTPRRHGTGVDTGRVNVPRACRTVGLRTGVRVPTRRHRAALPTPHSTCVQTRLRSTGAKCRANGGRDTHAQEMPERAQEEEGVTHRKGLPPALRDARLPKSAPRGTPFIASCMRLIVKTIQCGVDSPVESCGPTRRLYLCLIRYVCVGVAEGASTGGRGRGRGRVRMQRDVSSKWPVP